MDITDPTIQQLLKIVEPMSASERTYLLEKVQEWQRGIRRKNPRKAYTETVDYSDGESSFQDAAKNISAGGIMIAASRNFAIGQRLSIVIPFGNVGARFKFEGRVVWVNDDGIGVRFMGENKYFSEIILSTEF